MCKDMKQARFGFIGFITIYSLQYIEIINDHWKYCEYGWKISVISVQILILNHIMILIIHNKNSSAFFIRSYLEIIVFLYDVLIIFYQIIIHLIYLVILSHHYYYVFYYDGTVLFWRLRILSGKDIKYSI